jgi:hypothetical protein
MAQYIDKSALVAEIERKIKVNKKCMLGLRDIDYYHYQGKVDALNYTISFLDTLEVEETEEDPVSNDLEEAARKAATWHSRLKGDIFFENDFQKFIAGAEWQKEQMEKNRIEHCDNITEEQYNLETGFLDDFLDKNKRMPTFLDAIEYGMQKAQKGE